MKIGNYLLLLCLTIGSLSCQSDEEFLNLQNDAILEEKQDSERDYIFQMASFLNESIKEKQVLEALKDEAAKQIDGDYDVLLAYALDANATKSSRSGMNLLELISNKLPLTVKNGKMNFQDFVENFKVTAPLLNVYLPEDQDFSNMENFLTVILYSDFRDGKDQIVKALNVKGEIVEISAFEEPDVPYMVVGINERFDLSPQNIDNRIYSTQSPVFRTKYHNYYLSQSFEKKDQLQRMIELRSLKRSSTDSESYEVITRAKFRSRDAIRSVESWVRGKPEVEARVVFHNKGSLLDFVLGEATSMSIYMGENNWYTGKRRKPNPCDNYGNWFVVRWAPLAKQTKMKYIFGERDNGFNITLNDNLSFSVHGGDDMGSQYVHWKDNLNQTYPTSNLFEFEIGQRKY